MVEFFTYDSTHNKIVINEPEILLVKEFAALWDNERNKNEKDPTGEKKLRGFRELIYIYLAIDWRAPGNKSSMAERHALAIDSAELTKEEFDDPVFRAACKRYKELQDSSSYVGQVLETYKNNLHKIRIVLDNIDYSERKDNGEPIFKIKDTFAEMQALEKALDSLKAVEAKFKAEQDEASGLRGGQRPGLYDN